MKKWIIILLLAIIILAVVIPIIYKNQEAQSTQSKDIQAQQLNANNFQGKMKITSVFSNNTKIPEKYTCDGQDISPPLEISAIPNATKSLAIIADDPDAPSGTWVHWVVWNILANASIKIAEGKSPGTEGTTSFGSLGYGGPCPPSGTHRYFFKVYALDTLLSLKEGANKKQLEAAMQEHLLDKAELIGLYSKK
jgi:Raf kinase inhibitor-like YbhB/YbcL family protein